MPTTALAGAAARPPRSGGATVLTLLALWIAGGAPIPVATATSTAASARTQAAGDAPPDAARVSAAPTRAPAPPAAAPGGRAYNLVDSGARSPEEQRRGFTVPEGFEVELVAAEADGLGKFITVDWDARMRLWSMTALEYPVDANENPSESAALFAAGGRDRVVIFDAPYAAPAPGRAAATPRIFADGLVMPLGVLPWRDGALVQYGADIRWYRDTDADGRADQHSVVLTGFGTQDSHLFPHQFYRQPGGWILLAQGLFNYSTVRRPDGQPFADGSTAHGFNQCKLGRFLPDGSAWEALTIGPNNIWGLQTTREGETFIQEANDIGYPVVPFQPGIWIPTLAKDRFRPYQPLMPPPLEKPVMGGTGLSGLAIAEDRGSPFRDVAGPGAALVFYIANPITGAIQIIRADAIGGGRYRYAKQADFLTSEDRWFRPIASHFGPDGALYIVDWYNRIISHNEVPREHPDRDRTRGRIWRVRHRDQPRATPPDLTRLADADVLALIGGDNARLSRMAWLELTDRRATGLIPELRRLVPDRAAATDRRLGALWALEGLERPDRGLLETLAADPLAALRREAARLASIDPTLGDAEVAAILGRLVADPDATVRAAVSDGLRRVRQAGPATMTVALRLAQARRGDGDVWDRYERDFERYLARWALEGRPDITRALVEGPEDPRLPLENRLVGLLALGDRTAAERLAAWLPQTGRAPHDEEVRLLLTFAAEAAPRAALVAALADPAGRRSVIEGLVRARGELDPTWFTPVLSAPVAALLASSDAADQMAGADAAAAFGLHEAAPALGRILAAQLDPGSPPLTTPNLASLRALRSLRAAPVELLARIIDRPDQRDARREAVAALAEHPDPQGPETLVARLPGFAAGERGRALEALSASPRGTRALLVGLERGLLVEGELGVSTVERMRTALPDDPAVDRQWQRVGGDTLPVNTSETGVPMTPAEEAAQAEAIARYRSMANIAGNADNGRVLFEALCLICHVQGGRGGQLGPALDGLGHTGLEAILRNIVAPSAAMEASYRTFRVITAEGDIIEGFLAAQDAASVTLRIPGGAERRIERTALRSAGYLRRSLMPAGLLDGLANDQVRDLLSYLRSLR
jgi:putative heme-binding domain-containing protein